MSSQHHCDHFSTIPSEYIDVFNRIVQIQIQLIEPHVELSISVMMSDFD